MTEYANLVRDLAVRTRNNLEYVVAAKERGEDVYETTQLINSLLGTLVLIQQTKHLPETPLSDIKDFPKIKFCTGGGATQRFSKFIEFCRNAVCHGNFNATADGDDNEITHLMFWNLVNGKGPENWRIKCSIEDVRWIAIYLTEQNEHYGIKTNSSH